MRRLFLFFFLACALGVPAVAAKVSLDSELPPSVSGIKMLGVDGQRVSIDQIRGEKGTLVIFSCNHCPWVKAWERRMADAGNALMDRGIGVIMINSNDPNTFPEDRYEVMVERARAVGFRFPYVVDETSEVARSFGAKRTPEFYLFNKKGRLVYAGALDDNAQRPLAVKKMYLLTAAKEMMLGNAVTTPKTKSIGCSIKFR